MSEAFELWKGIINMYITILLIGVGGFLLANILPGSTTARNIAIALLLISTAGIFVLTAYLTKEFLQK